MGVISKANAEHYRWGDNCDGWHLLKSNGLSVIEECVPPGRAEVSHYHERAQQFFYVLAGEATLEVGGQLHRLAAGQGMPVPAGMVHRLLNNESSPLTFLVISSPQSHGDRITVD